MICAMKKKFWYHSKWYYYNQQNYHFVHAQKLILYVTKTFLIKTSHLSIKQNNWNWNSFKSKCTALIYFLLFKKTKIMKNMISLKISSIKLTTKSTTSVLLSPPVLGRPPWTYRTDAAVSRTDAEPVRWHFSGSSCLVPYPAVRGWVCVQHQNAASPTSPSWLTLQPDQKKLSKINSNLVSLNTIYFHSIFFYYYFFYLLGPLTWDS